MDDADFLASNSLFAGRFFKTDCRENLKFSCIILEMTVSSRRFSYSVAATSALSFCHFLHTLPNGP